MTDLELRQGNGATRSCRLYDLIATAVDPDEYATVLRAQLGEGSYSIAATEYFGLSSRGDQAPRRLLGVPGKHVLRFAGVNLDVPQLSEGGWSPGPGRISEYGGDLALFRHGGLRVSAQSPLGNYPLVGIDLCLPLTFKNLVTTSRTATRRRSFIRLVSDTDEV